MAMPIDIETPKQMLNRIIQLSTSPLLTARDRMAVRYVLFLLDGIGRRLEEQQKKATDESASPG